MPNFLSGLPNGFPQPLIRKRVLFPPPPPLGPSGGTHWLAGEWLGVKHEHILFPPACSSPIITGALPGSWYMRTDSP